MTMFDKIAAWLATKIMRLGLRIDDHVIHATRSRDGALRGVS